VSGILEGNLFPIASGRFSAPLEISDDKRYSRIDAMRPDPKNGENKWAGRLGTREAIKRDGLEIDTASLAFCPHERINSAGYVDLDLVRKFPLMLAL
jgi:hypothetical protein